MSDARTLSTSASAKSSDAQEPWRKLEKFRQTNKRTLENYSPASACRRPGKGWPPARRARQALIIRRYKPWLHSTGPKSEAGKKQAAKNALKHGMRSQAAMAELRGVRLTLRRCRAVTDHVNALLRGRSVGAGAHRLQKFCQTN